MPRKIVTLRDKYGSTTRHYPKVLKQCLPEELQDIFPLTKGNLTGSIYFDEWDTNALASVLEIKKDATHKAECRVYGNKYNDEDLYGVEMTYQEGSTLVGLTLNKNGVLLSGGLDKDININTYGTGKLYINGVEYQAGGGGSQLYQHEILVSYNGSSSTCRGKRTVINSKAEAYTKDELKVMFGSGGVQAGVYGIVNTTALNSLEYRENTGQWHFDYSGGFVNTNDSNVNVSDTVTPC